MLLDHSLFKLFNLFIKMSHKSTFIVFISLSLMLSCKNEINRPKTLLGYSYEKHISTTGRQAKAGDHAYFNVITMVGDSVLEDTHIYPFTPTMRIEVKPAREVAPIIDAIKEMAIGDSLTVFVPIDSLPFAPISFQSFKEIKHIITLIDLKTTKDFEIDMESRQAVLHALADSLRNLEASTKARLTSIIRDYSGKKLDSQLKVTEKGVKYMILKEGQGDQPRTGDMIEVNYTGGLTNELIFDSSFPKGQPYVYRLNTGQVIKGWDEALQNFKEGTEAILFIPSELGYGATGSSPDIPPHSELVFYVSLYKVRKM